MKIEIDQSMFLSAVRDAVGTGVAAGVGSYAVREAIQDAARQAVQESDLVQMVRDRLSTLIAETGGDIADEIVASSRSAVIRAMQEIITIQMARVMAQMSRPGGYLTSDQEQVLVDRAAAKLRGED